MECLEASIDSEAGVVFRSGRKENHPVCVSLVDSRNFIDDAATPPCGDARRGVRFLQNIRFASRDLHCRFIRYSPLASFCHETHAALYLRGFEAHLWA